MADKSSPLYKPKSCVRYCPFWFTISFALFIVALGIWTAYTAYTAETANDASNTLNADFRGNSSLEPVAGSLCIVYACLGVLFALFTIIRNVSEFKHDRNTNVGACSAVWMGFHVLLTILFWIIFIWNVVVVGGGAAFVASMVVAYYSIENLQNQFGVNGPAGNNPSNTGAPCPDWCLNWQIMPFVTGNNGTTCFCNYSAMATAKSQLDDAASNGFVMIGSSLFLVLFALAVLTNFMAQYSRMASERDYLERWQAYKKAHPEDPEAPKVILAQEPAAPPAEVDKLPGDERKPSAMEPPPQVLVKDAGSMSGAAPGPVPSATAPSVAAPAGSGFYPAVPRGA